MRIIHSFLFLVSIIGLLISGIVSTTGKIPEEYPSAVTEDDHILVIVDAQLYPRIQEKLIRYLTEVTERFPVVFSVVHVNGLLSKEPIAPIDLREILQEEYQKNCTVGVICIGQIPYALWEQGVGNNSGLFSVFYEDLDGAFEDTDNDGFYDYHSFGVNEGPEIWVCWMRPPILGQAFFMNHFLEKTHQYYTGERIPEKKAFVACHEDYDNNFYGPIGVVPVLEDIYGAAHIDTDGEGTDITTAKEIWKQLRMNRYEVFDTWQHANPNYQAWDTGGFSSFNIILLPQGALMTFLYGCHSADFWTAPGTTPFNINIAVSYVFGRSLCQASSGTSWSYGTEFKYLIYEAMRDHQMYLGNAWFAMESYVETASFVEQRYPDRDPHTECAGNTLIGNPFLYANNPL